MIVNNTSDVNNLENLYFISLSETPTCEFNLKNLNIIFFETFHNFSFPLLYIA